MFFAISENVENDRKNGRAQMFEPLFNFRGSKKNTSRACAIAGCLQIKPPKETTKAKGVMRGRVQCKVGCERMAKIVPTRSGGSCSVPGADSKVPKLHFMTTWPPCVVPSDVSRQRSVSHGQPTPLAPDHIEHYFLCNPAGLLRRSRSAIRHARGFRAWFSNKRSCG